MDSIEIQRDYSMPLDEILLCKKDGSEVIAKIVNLGLRMPKLSKKEARYEPQPKAAMSARTANTIARHGNVNVSKEW